MERTLVETPLNIPNALIEFVLFSRRCIRKTLGCTQKSFSRMLFQSNSRFVAVNLLKLCFSKVSDIVVRNLSEIR